MEKKIFENYNPEPEKFIIFHDESDCHNSNFLYHGFLFVPYKHGKEMLDILENLRDENWDSKWDPGKDGKTLHFKNLNGQGKIKIVNLWIDYVKVWLSEGKIRYYFFGIDKNNLDFDFWNDSHQNKIYLRFFEIGLRGSISWIKKCKHLPNGMDITHIFFDKGKLDEQRENTIKNNNFGIPKALDDDEKNSQDRKSLFIQLVDILNGITRLSFQNDKITNSARLKMMKNLKEIIDKFSNQKTAFNPNSELYKKFTISFFPKNAGLKKEDFLEKNLEYHFQQRDSFYCDRETYWKKQAKESVQILF